MHRMLEVVGTSPVSYTEATRDAVTTVAKSGQVYWFEVVELRGGVRDGKIEFQAKLKAATKD